MMGGGGRADGAIVDITDNLLSKHSLSYWAGLVAKKKVGAYHVPLPKVDFSPGDHHHHHHQLKKKNKQNKKVKMHLCPELLWADKLIYGAKLANNLMILGSMEFWFF